ncbi:MAG: methionine gamma-lyase family protein, partial [Clostridia bacterium]|nr:methionine gamma-lyase family protein [Clostridia bacterium]
MRPVECELLGISARAYDYVRKCEGELEEVFAGIEDVEGAGQARVLAAFQQEGIALRHFASTTGYGYDDIGRDALDRVFAAALEAEDALVRPQITSGNHAIFTALSGLLEPGDAMLSLTGKPYDTLEKAIGISGNEYNSLARMGVKYSQVDLLNGKIDLEASEKALFPQVKVVYFQRSRGYSWRNALTPEEMQPAFELVRRIAPGAFIVVDNCYGGFTRMHEPTYYGADVIIGSLIKNLGGGIAPTGGYIAGTKRAIERIEMKLTVPGMGREVGSYAGSYAPFYQGLFMAPHVTAQAVKSAVLFARVFEKAGMISMPASTDERSDIVQSLRFNSADALISFCRSIQKAAPVDSFVQPEPWDMPGYTSQVIMAAGAFVQ